MEIPIKAYAASMGTTMTYNTRSNHIWEKIMYTQQSLSIFLTAFMSIDAKNVPPT